MLTVIVQDFAPNVFNSVQDEHICKACRNAWWKKKPVQSEAEFLEQRRKNTIKARVPNKPQELEDWTGEMRECQLCRKTKRVSPPPAHLHEWRCNPFSEVGGETICNACHVGWTAEKRKKEDGMSEEQFLERRRPK